MPGSGKYLSPEAIAHLKGLELRARAVVSGFLSGMHRSAYRGYSVEFAEHRQYVPGDDPRHIDWRLFGRKDRFYVKQYEEETNLTCQLVVDASASMAYQSGPLSKLEYASAIAASIAWLLTQQQDATALLAFDSEVRAGVPSGTGRAHLAHLIDTLEQLTPQRTTEAKLLLHRLAAELKRRSIIVLLSDLLMPAEDLIDGIEHLAHAGHDVLVCHVLDHDEWEFPFQDQLRFEALEDDALLLADAQAYRERYRDALAQFVDTVRKVCLKMHADYIPIDTHDPFASVLGALLRRRSRSIAGSGRA